MTGPPSRSDPGPADPATDAPIAAPVTVTLNAVFAAVEARTPKVLCVETPGAALSLPYGPFDPARHRTFEIGVREWVERQTRIRLGFIEQLYTFGDAGRDAPAAARVGAGLDAGESERVVSVGYLALADTPASVMAPGASWRDWYDFFPWEDRRGGAPSAFDEAIAPALQDWAADAPSSLVREERRQRLALAFGDHDADSARWPDARALDRYEIMYEAGLVSEAMRDRGARQPPPGAGLAMASDHRRILATAIGRLRGKLRYRPVLFELAPPTFTLLDLQEIAEAIIGARLHKQNFRRAIEKSGFVTPTGATAQASAGRPAALFRADPAALAEHADRGVSLPRQRD